MSRTGVVCSWLLEIALAREWKKLTKNPVTSFPQSKRVQFFHTQINESKKILRDDSFSVTATAVRIPTAGGHSESVNIEFKNDFDVDDVRKLLSETPGVVVQDDLANHVYPMPAFAHNKDEVFVGRIRRDESQENSLNLWIVSDNLRKGAATNTVQIAEYLIENDLL